MGILLFEAILLMVKQPFLGEIFFKKIGRKPAALILRIFFFPLADR